MNKPEVDALILNLIPANAGLVVELGGHSPDLKWEFQRNNPVGQYLTKSPIDCVSDHFIGDPAKNKSPENTEFDTRGILKGSVDVLVYKNYLEYLTDPLKTLKQQVEWLKEDGVIVAILPNFGHGDVFLHLLKGESPQNQTTLGQSHLQAFTQKSMMELFSKSGLLVVEVKKIELAVAHHELLLSTLAPLAKILGNTPEDFSEQLLAKHYLFMARRTEKHPRKIFIQAAVSPPPCNRVRILEPNSFLNSVPGIRTSVLNGFTQPQPAMAGEEKIFIWQRAALTPSEAIKRQKMLLKDGFLTIAEWDDDPRHWPQFLENIHITLRCCHAVQTSTVTLAQYLRQFNPNVMIVPNYLAALPPRRNLLAKDQIHLFFGALNRQQDWQILMPALNHILHTHHRRIHFRVIHDRAFFDALQTNDKTFTSFCDFEDYQKILHECDIAILPLADTPANRMKSDLKFLECAGHGVVALASSVVYSDSVLEGKTGMLFNNPEEFEFKLMDLLDNPSKLQAISKNAFDWVRDNRLLSRHFRDRLNGYQKLLDNLPDLNKELQVRVPGLFT